MATPRPKLSPKDSAIHKAISALSRLNPDDLADFAKRLHTQKRFTALALRECLSQVIETNESPTE